MDHHWQGSFNETVRLKDVIFELLELGDFNVEHLELLLHLALVFDLFFNFQNPIRVDLQCRAYLLKLLAGLE